MRTFYCEVLEPLRSGNLKLFFLCLTMVGRKKNGFLTMVRQEEPNPIGYKYNFTHLNWFCLVLPWLDARRNHLKFPLLVCPFHRLYQGYVELRIEFAYIER